MKKSQDGKNTRAPWSQNEYKNGIGLFFNVSAVLDHDLPCPAPKAFETRRNGAKPCVFTSKSSCGYRASVVFSMIPIFEVECRQYTATASYACYDIEVAP